MLANAKIRAKKKNLDFNIELSDLVIPSVCPISLIEIKVCTGKVGDSSPTLDRIDNSKGYIKGNVDVISQRANTRKGDMSLEEIKRLHNYCKGIRS